MTAGNDIGRKSQAEPAVYQFRVQGSLNRRWTDWFGGMTIAPEEDGDTLLTGPVTDQAELYGLLKRVRDLGMPLISVTRVEPDRASSKGDTS